MFKENRYIKLRHLLKYLKNAFLKLRQIQLKIIQGTMTTVKKQLNSANKLYLNSKDIQTISMTSKYLELKPVEQLKFQSVSHGDHMFRKSIIKHLLKSLRYDKKNLWKTKSPRYTHLNRVGADNKATSKQTLLTL